MRLNRFTGPAARPQSPGPAGGGPRGNGATRGKIHFEKGSGVTIKRLLKYIHSGGYTVMFVLSLVCMVVNAQVSVRSSLFIRTVIDDFIGPLLLQSTPDYGPLVIAIRNMAILYACGIISSYAMNVLLTLTSHGVLNTIRNEMFGKMQELPVKYFDTNSYGDIMSRYTNDVDSMRQMLSMSVPQVLSSLVTIVSIFVAMVRLSLPLTGIEILSIFVIYFLTATIGARSAKYFRERQKTLGDVNGYIEEMLNGQKVVMVFCHEEKAKEAFDKKNEELCEKTTRANAFANILMPMMGNLGNFKYALIAMIGGALAISGNGGLSLGAIASFLLLSKNFNMPISQISQQINSVAMALAGAKRVFELMDEEPEKDSGYVTLVNAEIDGEGNIKEVEEKTGKWAWRYQHKTSGEVEYRELKGDVRMEHVDFGYTPDKMVLHDVSLYAKPGQKIAFVGSTGAGKTTITNLINRFYDIEDGKIRYDGININKIKRDDLRRSLGMVLQDTNLFTGTIKENIRYGKLDATDEEIMAAAKLANAHDFIRRLPQGYDTVISGTGSQLSQGQCQLLAIARCAVADPPVMILDEATSSIDTRTETLIQKGMDKLMHGRTVFVIAHRLSTVQNSNAIMVLENGRIIERGDHDDLIAQQGKYYHLYTGK